MKKLFILLLALSLTVCDNLQDDDQTFGIEIISMTKNSVVLGITSRISGTAYGMVNPTDSEPPDSEILKQSKAKVRVEVTEKVELKIDLIDFSLVAGEEYKAYVMFIKQTIGDEPNILSKEFIFKNGDGNSNSNENWDGNVCVGDGNNKPECATKLSLGHPFHSQINIDTDVDFYSFDVESEGIYTILTYDQGENLCSLDTTLILYGSDGKTILSSNDDASDINAPVPDPCSAIRGVLRSNGVYFIRVKSSALGRHLVGDYTVKVSFDPVSGTEISQSLNTTWQRSDRRSSFQTSLAFDSGFDTCKIGDINVGLTIYHNYVADLDIFLTSPSGTSVELSTDNGGGSDNYIDTIFDDESNQSITSGSAPFTDSYQPEGSLSNFDNEDPTGEWVLNIDDDEYHTSCVSPPRPPGIPSVCNGGCGPRPQPVCNTYDQVPYNKSVSLTLYVICE